MKIPAPLPDPPRRAAPPRLALALLGLCGCWAQIARQVPDGLALLPPALRGERSPLCALRSIGAADEPFLPDELLGPEDRVGVVVAPQIALLGPVGLAACGPRDAIFTAMVVGAADHGAVTRYGLAPFDPERGLAGPRSASYVQVHGARHEADTCVTAELWLLRGAEKYVEATRVCPGAPLATAAPRLRTPAP